MVTDFVLIAAGGDGTDAWIFLQGTQNIAAEKAAGAGQEHS